MPKGGGAELQHFANWRDSQIAAVKSAAAREREIQKGARGPTLSAMYKGAQHLHDYYEQVADRPVVVRRDPLRAEICIDVPDRLFGLPACDPQHTNPVSISAAAEGLANIRPYCVDGLPHLVGMQQSFPGRTIDQIIDPVLRAFAGVEHVQVAVCHSANVLERDDFCVIILSPP